MAPLPNFRGRLPRPGGATSSITRDPAAEAYYSNDPAMVASAVRQGYARGGDVRDPMDYVPDALPTREEPRNTYDPYNTIGREEPKVSPLLAYEEQRSGYAEGGEVDDEEERRRREMEATGYAQPARKEEGSTLGKVMDYIHGMFSVGEAGAAENPQLPQRPAAPQPDISAAAPRTGYNPGGYGGELTSPPPEVRGGSPDEVTAKPLPPPLSLQAQAPPSISGQDTPRVAEIPAGSPLGQARSAAAARQKAAGTDPESQPGIARMLWDLPGALGDKAREADARAAMYEGTAGQQLSGWWEGKKRGLQSLLYGEHPNTPEEAIRVLEQHPLDPGHNKMVQDTFNELGKTKGVDAQANFVQKMRPGYNNLMSTGVAALADNNVVDAMRLVSAAHNLLPNERKLDFQLDPKGGGIIATVQPEGPGGGQPMAVRLTAAQFYDFVTGPASQFDVVAKNGIEKSLRS